MLKHIDPGIHLLYFPAVLFNLVLLTAKFKLDLDKIHKIVVSEEEDAEHKSQRDDSQEYK